MFFTKKIIHNKKFNRKTNTNTNTCDNNDKNMGDNFLNILLRVDFDSPDCVEKFNKEIELLDNAYDIDEHFFNIYDFVGLHIDDDVEKVKKEYEELINLTKSNKTINCSYHNTNSYFKIYLDVLKQKNKYLNNVNMGIDTDVNFNLDIQINILESICKILSNVELKNIYDKYYLDWKINDMKTNGELETEGKKKMDLIDKVYSNLFLIPVIKSNRTTHDFNNIISDFETQLEIRKNEYMNTLNNQNESSSEHPPEKYNKTYLDSFTKTENNSEKYYNEINTLLNQISHPDIKCDGDEFLHKIIKKYNLEAKDINKLLNYYLHKKIIYCQSKKSYDTYTKNIDYSDSYHSLEMFDDYTKIFEEKFDINNFYEWAKLSVNDDNKDVQKNITYFEKDLNDLLKNRNDENESFKKFIDKNLNHFAQKVYEFGPNIYYPEMDYSSYFFSNNLEDGLDDNFEILF